MKKTFLILTIIILTMSFTCCSIASSIQDLENQQSTIEDNKSNAEKELEGVKTEKSEALTAIEELSDQISESEEQLDNLNTQIKTLEKEIKKTQQELDDAQERQDAEQTALEQRIVAQYKTSGTLDYWKILLNPKSPLEFISNIHMFKKIAKYDNDLIESIEAEKQIIEKAKADLDNKKSEVKIAKAEAEKENVKLKNAKMQKNNQVAKLSDAEKELQAKIDEYQQEMDNIEAEMKRIAAEASKGSSGATFNGQLQWPCPNYVRISSYFGGRESPGGGVGSRNHKGVDLAASHGSSIVAAESGTVITVSNKCTHDYPKTVATKCSCGGGYGNYVMISHGNGLVTLYGHCSTINVSVGQTVTRGQKIAGVGTTGYSTGNHLHFGVLVNGSYVNPLPYIQ